MQGPMLDHFLWWIVSRLHTQTISFSSHRISVSTRTALGIFSIVIYSRLFKWHTASIGRPVGTQSAAYFVVKCVAGRLQVFCIILVQCTLLSRLKYRNVNLVMQCQTDVAGRTWMKGGEAEDIETWSSLSGAGKYSDPQGYNAVLINIQAPSQAAQRHISEN